MLMVLHVCPLVVWVIFTYPAVVLTHDTIVKLFFFLGHLKLRRLNFSLGCVSIYSIYRVVFFSFIAAELVAVC
jgi:hypothetical protein